MYDFEKIAALLPFFRQAFDPDAEILLCDTKEILYAEHPLTERTKPGNPIGDMERSFISEGTYKTQDSVLNYRALSPSRERLRASTYFIKNDVGELEGFLTVNLQIEQLLKVRDVVDYLINGTPSSTAGAHTPRSGRSAKNRHTSSLPISRYEGVNVSIQDIIQSVLDEFLASFGIPADRLTAAERIQIVCELDRRGVFLVKGSIAEVAQRLNCSEATIYRYLQQLP